MVVNMRCICRRLYVLEIAIDTSERTFSICILQQSATLLGRKLTCVCTAGILNGQRGSTGGTVSRYGGSWSAPLTCHSIRCHSQLSCCCCWRYHVLLNDVLVLRSAIGWCDRLIISALRHGTLHPSTQTDHGHRSWVDMGICPPTFLRVDVVCNALYWLHTSQFSSAYWSRTVLFEELLILTVTPCIGVHFSNFHEI